MNLTIGEASKFLNVSHSTMRRWEKSGKLLPTFRTIGRHRRYSLSLLKEFIGDFLPKEKRRVIGYARVSSHDQKKDLERQIIRLEQYCEKENSDFEIIDDLGSGMNFKKKGLKKLIKLLISGQVSKLILPHKDRLLRFGSEIIFSICEYFGTEVELVEQKLDQSDEQVLAFDVLEIITVFSARLYGKRSHQNKKAIA